MSEKTSHGSSPGSWGKLLLETLRPQAKGFFKATLYLSGSALFAIFASLLFAPLFDRGIIPGRILVMCFVLAAQLVCLLIRGALSGAAFQDYALTGAYLANRLTLRTYELLKEKPLQFYQDYGKSEFLQLLRGDTAVIEGAFSHLVGQMVVAAVQITVVLVVLLLWVPSLALLGALGLAGVAALSRVGARLTERGLSREIESNVRVGEHILSTLGLEGMLLLTSASPDWASERIKHLLDEYTRALIRRRTLPQWALEGSFGVSHLIQFIFYLAGGYLVVKGRLTLGELVALAALLTYLTAGAQQLASSAIGLKDGLVRLGRLQAEMIEGRDAERKAEAPSEVKISGGYEMRGVTVVYPGGRHGLSKVTATIPKGKVTVVAGRSGAGKTTLACLMLRLLEPTEGDVTLDGAPLSSFARKELWQRIGYVPQEVVLFRGSVRDNILLGRRGSDDDLKRCLDAAYVHDRIISGDAGYDADVGESGSRFSAGERQRIVLARALLTQPSVIILDEPTAHIDQATEALIYRTMADIRDTGNTVVLLSHKVPPHADVGHLLILDEGRLIFEGSPKELAKKENLRELFLE